MFGLHSFEVNLDDSNREIRKVKKIIVDIKNGVVKRKYIEMRVNL